MEKNALNKITYLIILLVAIQSLFILSCKAKKDNIKINEEVNYETNIHEIDTTFTSTFKKLAELNSLGCGDIQKGLNFPATFYLNRDLINCIKKDSIKYLKYRSILNEISEIIDYRWQNQYVDFFSFIQEFNDSKSFTIAIEFLADDYQPILDSSSHVYIESVKDLAFKKLIVPHIYSIDGHPKDSNSSIWKNLFKNYHSLMSTEEFYKYTKGLWENDRIVLSSQISNN